MKTVASLALALAALALPAARAHADDEAPSFEAAPAAFQPRVSLVRSFDPPIALLYVVVEVDDAAVRRELRGFDGLESLVVHVPGRGVVPLRWTGALDGLDHHEASVSLSWADEDALRRAGLEVVAFTNVGVVSFRAAVALP